MRRAHAPFAINKISRLIRWDALVVAAEPLGHEELIIKTFSVYKVVIAIT